MMFYKPKGVLRVVAFISAAFLGVMPMLCHSAPLKEGIADQALANCVQEIANNNNWTKADQVTHIKCHSAGIKSLSGMDSLPNLESVSLYNNALKQLDVDLAQFKKLSTLNLARNHIEQLTLANMPAVKKVYLFGNGMKNLTLTNLPALALIKTNNNKLEQFSYSKTPNLEKIYIFNNKLETIDIYVSPKLQYMDCRQNPMPDELYDEMDEVETATFLHDGNADDWQ